MRIGILTLPLNVNYGGILQAYALQTILERNGYETELLNDSRFPTVVPNRFSLIQRLFLYPYRFLRKIVFGHPKFIMPDLELVNRYKFISFYTQQFIDRYIHNNTTKLSNLMSIDAIVVGSDQVWRGSFTNASIVDYFLSFLDERSKIKRIAYAASFGTDEWEINEENTIKCAQLIKKFDLVTVREDSGIILCNKFLNTQAHHVLDPTMLLEVSDYINLLKEENEPINNGNLFVYVLDGSTYKTSFINMVAEYYSLIPFYKKPDDTHFYDIEFPFNYRECSMYPTVTSWLRCFMDAKFIITDSFHGCVFSIIFNKPFYVIGNSERGMARFTSLLKLFELEDRMIDVHQIDSIQPSTDIDWDKVNRIRKSWKEKSLCLLIGALNK